MPSYELPYHMSISTSGLEMIPEQAVISSGSEDENKKARRVKDIQSAINMQTLSKCHNLSLTTLILIM
uniref:BHLH domain-containing protein n=1 Tax=Heterorhabditis bacteriophora TaxID=37862 RepID=A0A1I7WXM7_HETBA